MKAIFRSGFFLLALGCTNADQQTLVLDPLEEVKEIFRLRSAGADSVSVVENDSTCTYFILPATEEITPGKELFGAFTIEKKTFRTGDLNGDGLEDAVVQYSFTPHLENNTLVYFKVLLQNGGKLEEVGEIYGGGRCEGPILSLQEIKNGIVYFKGKDYAAGDPCCCPSLQSEHAFKWENGRIFKN